MFKNYFKTALRSLYRYKGFAFINIISLTIGIVGCLFIALFVWQEKQYDRFVPGGENIYRVYEQRNDNTVISYVACVPPAFGTYLKQEYPEVAVTARILMSDDKYLVENGDKKGYEEKGMIVDSTFFQVFPLPFIKGNPAIALQAPNSIVLEEDLARRYFGNQDPIGKTVRINKDNRVVSGVFAKLPNQFHLSFRYLMPMSAAGLPADRMQKWDWHQFYTYIRLVPGATAAKLQDKFQAHVRTAIFPTLDHAGSTFLPVLQPLHDIHLKSSDFIYDNAIRGNETYVKALSIIALFVLIIACFNFINLATARSFRRAKEIGVRKVIGADRRQLIIQFISETILLAVFSMLFAMAITFFLMPLFNSFTGKAILFNPFTNPLLGLGLLLAGGVIGVAAGIYPALVLSSFQPIKVLKSMKLTGSNSSAWLRQALVIVQFALSVLLIVSTLIVFRQTKYLTQKDLGFNRDQIVYFQLRDSLVSNPATLETFKAELRSNPNVVAVTSGYGLPGDLFAGDGVVLPTAEGEKAVPANLFVGDYEYLKTLGLHLVAGRDFSRNMRTDEKEAFIINETAVREWGFGTPEKALGQPIHWSEWAPADTSQPVKRGKVVGVVQDFHYKSLHEKVTASVIQLYPQVTYTAAAKIRTADIQNTLTFISDKWNQFTPAYPLAYQFMDDTYAAMYKSEEKLSDLLWIFTVMAIFIGCMGLFGLAAFSAEQRTKEIGIRKVLGATVFNIIGLLSKRFLALVGIAALIAMPIAWWAMTNWLANFPYRVAISWWVFGAAVAAALSIAFLTVGFQSIRVATTNPVKSLHNE